MNIKISNGMYFLKNNLGKIFLVGFLFVVPIISFAQNPCPLGTHIEIGLVGCIPDSPNPTPDSNLMPLPTQSRIPLPSNPDCNPDKQICNPIRANSVVGFVKTLLEGLIRIGMPVLAVAIIYCGFLFVSARGNSEKVTKAKDSLLYTLIGAAVILGSWAIAQVIANTVTAL